MATQSPEGPNYTGATSTDRDPVREAYDGPTTEVPVGHRYGDNLKKIQREKRTRMMKLIGVPAAGLALIGTGFFANRALSGSEAEAEPVPEPAPTANTAPATPGTEVEPTDGSTPTEATPIAEVMNAENFAEFTNQEIMDWYTIDREMIASLQTNGVRDFVAERGGQTQTFDPAEFFESRNEEGAIRYAVLEQNSDGSFGELTPLYNNAETNLELFVNTVLANRDLFTDLDANRSGEPAMALQGLTETFLLESHRDMVQGDDGYDQADSYIVTNLVDFALSQPEGTVVTNFGLAVERSTQGPTAHEENGTWAVINLRHADGTEEKVGSYRLSEGGANPYVIDLNGGLAPWDQYKHEGQEAFMLWDSERRFATE